MKGGQYSDEARQALQRLLDIFLPSHRAITRKNSSTTYPASVLQISIHTFKESLSVSLFRSQHIDGSSGLVWMQRIDWSSGSMKMPDSRGGTRKAHHLVTAGGFSRSPSGFIFLKLCMSSNVGSFHFCLEAAGC